MSVEPHAFRARSLLLATVALAALLAGCSDGPGRSPTLEPPPAETSANGHRIEMLDCTTYWLQVPADTAKMEALMPAGYTLDDIPLVGLDAWVCSSAVLDNSTVFHDVRYYSVELPVDPPENVQNQAGGDGYELESCLNVAELRTLLEEIGFKVCDGTVEMTLTGPDIHLQYFQADALAYDFMGVGEVDRSDFGTPRTVRIHQATDTMQSWYDRDSEPLNPSPPGEAGPLTVQQGVLAQILPHPGETTVARGGIGSGTYVKQLPPPTTHA